MIPEFSIGNFSKLHPRGHFRVFVVDYYPLFNLRCQPRTAPVPFISGCRAERTGGKWYDNKKNYGGKMNISAGAGKNLLLAVGEEYHLRQGKDRIVYGGMPSEEVYSIVQKKASGYQGYAWSLFFSRKQRDITVDGVKLYIERVAPEEIQLRVG
jgi:hypothetical protein